MSFVIVTDSASSLSYKYITENDVKMTSYKYYAGETEHDTFQYTHDDGWIRDFYGILRKKQSAHTSCVNAEEFTGVFTDILESGSDFICLTLSGQLSATYSIALNAAEKLKPLYPGRQAYVYDSRTAAQGQGLVVDYAVKYRNEGCTAEEAYNKLVRLTPNICQWFVVEDLFFLKRGGRISAVTAVAGTALGIKPVLHVDDEGRLVKMGTARGRKGSLDALINRFGDTAINPKRQKVFIGHGDCIDDLKYVQRQIKDKFGVKEFETGYINPVIGVHSGPGTVALFYYGTSR